MNRRKMKQVRMTLEGPASVPRLSFKVYTGVLSIFLLEVPIIGRTSDLSFRMCQEGRTR